MIPKKYAPIVFGFILSCLMSGMVSGIATFRAIEAGQAFFGPWVGSWMSSWAVAFPVVLVVAPVTRRLVAKITRD